MRWIILALAGFACAAPAADAAPPAGCGPKAAHTIRQSATIRVFVQKGSYFACWRRSRARPIELLAESLGQIRLRGRFVTFVDRSCDPSRCEFAVRLVDVERRRTVVSVDFLPGAVRTLVATRGGAAAFLADDGQERYIQKLDALGAEEVDRGAGVHSLTLHGGRLHWLHGSRERDDHIAHIRSCGPTKGATTEALTRNVRVYYTAPYGDDEYHHFACLLDGGKPLFLGADEPGNTAYGYFGFFQPVGRHVFFFEYQCGLEGCSEKVYSADLAKRTQRSGRWTFNEGAFLYPNARGFAAELYRPTESSSTYRLYSFDSRGDTLLEESAAIDPGSIVVYADAVVWRSGGEQRSAPLR